MIQRPVLTEDDVQRIEQSEGVNLKREGDRFRAREAIAAAVQADIPDNGVINAAFQVELERCVLDCQDRPSDDRSRVVTLTVRLLTPVVAGELALLTGLLIMLMVQMLQTLVAQEMEV